MKSDFTPMILKARNSQTNGAVVGLYGKRDFAKEIGEKAHDVKFFKQRGHSVGGLPTSRMRYNQTILC